MFVTKAQPRTWKGRGKIIFLPLQFSPSFFKFRHACLIYKSCLTLCDPMDCSLPGSFRPWDFPGKNTGVGCHLIQGSSTKSTQLLKKGLISPKIIQRGFLDLGNLCMLFEFHLISTDSEAFWESLLLSLFKISQETSQASLQEMWFAFVYSIWGVKNLFAKC